MATIGNLQTNLLPFAYIFLQIHATTLINHTPAGLQGKNTGTDITLLHSKVTLKYFRKCLPGETSRLLQNMDPKSCVSVGYGM